MTGEREGVWVKMELFPARDAAFCFDVDAFTIEKQALKHYLGVKYALRARIRVEQGQVLPGGICLI